MEPSKLAQTRRMLINSTVAPRTIFTTGRISILHWSTTLVLHFALCEKPPRQACTIGFWLNRSKNLFPAAITESCIHVRRGWRCWFTTTAPSIKPLVAIIWGIVVDVLPGITKRSVWDWDSINGFWQWLSFKVIWIIDTSGHLTHKIVPSDFSSSTDIPFMECCHQIGTIITGWKANSVGQIPKTRNVEIRCAAGQCPVVQESVAHGLHKQDSCLISMLATHVISSIQYIHAQLLEYNACQFDWTCAICPVGLLLLEWCCLHFSFDAGRACWMSL